MRQYRSLVLDVVMILFLSMIFSVAMLCFKKAYLSYRKAEKMSQQLQADIKTLTESRN